MNLPGPFLLFPLTELIHHFLLRYRELLRLCICHEEIFKTHLYIMEHFIHPQFKARRLFPTDTVPVNHKLQRSRRPVGEYRPVVQQIQVQADSRPEPGQDAEAHKQPLLLLPRKETPEHHGHGMILQNLHIPD